MAGTEWCPTRHSIVYAYNIIDAISACISDIVNEHVLLFFVGSLACDFQNKFRTNFLISGYTLETYITKENVPIFLLGGVVEWYVEKFGRRPDDGLAAKGQAVADVLLSMMLGGFEARRRYEAALAAIDAPVKKARFIDEWQDGLSSLNDIGSAAHKLGRKLKEAHTA